MNNPPELDLMIRAQNSIHFQERLRADPDSVTDDEIRAEFGDEFEPRELRDTFRKSTFGRIAKDPKKSARAMLRRRLRDLDNVLVLVVIAVNQVLDAPGRTNNRAKLELLLVLINKFRDEAELSAPDGEPLDRATSSLTDFLEKLISDASTSDEIHGNAPPV
jgi:hypothetical protein